MLPEGELIRELSRRFGAQVIILYGSHARGEAGPGSDVDVACFCTGSARYPLTFHWQDLLIDAWLHPLADLSSRDGLSKVHGGRVLLDLDARGAALLAQIDSQFATARTPLDGEHERHLRAWVWKMLDRASVLDLHGFHRRHWLLHELPEVWCDLSGRHFTGAASTLRDMTASSEQLAGALPLAMHPDATLEQIQALVTLVAGPRPA